MKDWDFYQVLPRLADEGVAYLKGRKDAKKPFFLYFSFPSPHAPIVPTDEFDGKSQAGAYGDFVVQTDHIVGRLIQALKDSGQYDRTIVLFSADNGPEHYAYARDEKFNHWSAHPLRGLKRDIYEGGHRVPYILKWPGLTKGGTVNEALVSQIDVFATLADYLKYEIPSTCAEDSHNLMPLLRGEKKVVRENHVHNTRKNHYAIRSGDWLLVNAPTGISAAAMPTGRRSMDALRRRKKACSFLTSRRISGNATTWPKNTRRRSRSSKSCSQKSVRTATRHRDWRRKKKR